MLPAITTKLPEQKESTSINDFDFFEILITLSKRVSPLTLILVIPALMSKSADWEFWTKICVNFFKKPLYQVPYHLKNIWFGLKLAEIQYIGIFCL